MFLVKFFKRRNKEQKERFYIKHERSFKLILLLMLNCSFSNETFNGKSSQHKGGFMGRILSVSFWAQNARALQILPESKSPDHLKIRTHTKSSRKKQPAKRKSLLTKNLSMLLVKFFKRRNRQQKEGFYKKHQRSYKFILLLRFLNGKTSLNCFFSIKPSNGKSSQYKGKLYEWATF